ncbi:MAG: DUF4129 domain-containing protein [Saprospiraceae bacterium]|nr:DUF4129 domain-containing protein [Saprospiraceae bacterium]
MTRTRIVAFVVLCMSCQASVGQNTLWLPDSSSITVRSFDEEVLGGISEDPAFDYGPRLSSEPAVSVWWRQMLRKISDLLFGDGRHTDKVLMTGLIVAAVVFLVVFFGKTRLRGILARRAGRSPVTRKVLDEEVELATIDAHIARSVRDGDFRMALRWTYLALLLGLDEQGAIEVRRSKTNRDYRQEMTGHPSASSFDRLATIFDYSWYGGKAVDASAFGSFTEEARRIEQNSPVA